MNKHIKKSAGLLLGAAMALGVSGLTLAESKKTLPPRSEAALEVDKFFWQVFNNGEYEKIPAILDAMMGVYLADPNDSLTAAHIGWTYLWRVSEQRRLAQAPVALLNDFSVGRKYFERAALNDPSDARFLAGVALAQVTEGILHHENKNIKEGSQKMQRSVTMWPEFNLFTTSFLASRSPSDTAVFKKGLEDIWRNVDVCIGKKFSRTQPDMTPYLSMATTGGKKGTCWNGDWRAPHNFEGFFLHMGDMVVKSGDWALAQKVYANAKLMPEYATWKYREVLEERILHAQENVAEFNALPDATGRIKNPVMANSTFSCMACHQN